MNRIAMGRLAAAVIAVVTLSAPTGVAWAESDGLSGDPDAAAQYWGRQHYDDCALMAVADVVGEVTGTKPSEDEIIALAGSIPNGRGSGPIYIVASDPAAASGTIPRKNQLGLALLLADGKKVIASINGETIWDQAGDRTVHDHDVVVTGIDTGSGIVHLNDSAIPSPGPDSQVSIATFESAWRTSDHAMVVAG
ncbi:MAG: hypothetical protein NT146_15790 [Mycobacterium sp.]|nr:hypothetical protein [Mycobacterium sp.]